MQTIRQPQITRARRARGRAELPTDLARVGHARMVVGGRSYDVYVPRYAPHGLFLAYRHCGAYIERWCSNLAAVAATICRQERRRADSMR